MQNKIQTDAFEANSDDMIKELEDLLMFNPPGKFKDHILEVFFTYLIELKPTDYPQHHNEIVEDIYFLYLFFNKLDELNTKIKVPSKEQI